MSLSTFRFVHTDLRKGVTGVCQDSLSRRVVVYRSRKLYPPWNYILRWIQVRKQGEALFPWRVGDYVRVTTWELGGGDKPEIFGGRVYWSWRIETQRGEPWVSLQVSIVKLGSEEEVVPMTQRPLEENTFEKISI